MNPTRIGNYFSTRIFIQKRNFFNNDNKFGKLTVFIKLLH